jgi:Zn-dependent protease with chaperone function
MSQPTVAASADPSPLSADYFDGRSARAHPVQLGLADGELHIRGNGIALRVPASQVEWPERMRHGPRIARLPDGGSVQCSDAQAWDAWALAGGRTESLVVRAQQSWRWVLASVVALAIALGALYLWGVPWLGQVAVAATPLRVDRALGESALQSLDEQLLRPSRLPPEQQQRLRAAFERALAGMPPGSVPAHRLDFRSGPIGPNAFALPGGTMVLTDALVELVQGDEAVIVGVLGHELGHVKHRHGLRLLVQASAIAALSSVVLGDFSTLLAGAPVLLGQASYSRDAEREADAHAVAVLKAGGLSPAVMVGFFEKVASRGRPGTQEGNAKGRAGSGLGIAIASHPADEERMQFFRDAAAR